MTPVASPVQQLTAAQRAIAAGPLSVGTICQLLAEAALALTGATTVAVLDRKSGTAGSAQCSPAPATPDAAGSGDPVGDSVGDSVGDGDAVGGVIDGVGDAEVAELRALAGETAGERNWRQGSALVALSPGPDACSLRLAVGSCHAPLPEGAAALCEGLLAVAAARLQAADAVAALAALEDEKLARAPYRHALQEAQRIARVGSWMWMATEANPGGIFEGGGFQSWTSMLFELLELTDDGSEPSTDAFLGAVHPEDRHIPGQELERALGGGVATMEYRVPLVDGSVRWLHGTVECAFDSEGTPIRVSGTALDVTERRRAESDTRAAEEQFRLAMEFAPLGIALVGLDGRTIRVNQPLGAMLGRDPADLVACAVEAFVHPDDLSRASSSAMHLVNGVSASTEVDVRLVRADGSFVWTRTSASMLLDRDGEPQHVIVHVQDNAERRARQEDLERQANTDPLTGLMNRRGWESALLTHLDAAVVDDLALAISILDIDHFKVYNDTFGHPAGDQLLSELAQLWTGRLLDLAADGRLPTMARIGGEEFGVALPGYSAEEAREVVVGLCSLTPRGQSTSAGLTLWDPGEKIGDTLARADGALYSAKRNGRRRVIAVLPA